MLKRVACGAVLAAAGFAAIAVALAAPIDAPNALRVALALGCEDARLSPAAMVARLPGAVRPIAPPTTSGGRRAAWRRSFELANGGEIDIERMALRDGPAKTTAQYDAPAPTGVRPVLFVIGGPKCSILGGRRLIYDGGGRATGLLQLDGDLVPIGAAEPLKSPVPAGRDPGGITVAQVDTGVNYLLPAIARHLARNRSGQPLGFDYWDMDDEPFDSNPVPSPFYPERHGTATASVLLREAPAARLIPYRYPRPDMARLGALVDDAVRKGARVMTMSLGSDDRAEWASFAAAVERHPDLLVVVSAGNDRRDLDRHPVFPAALHLANMITVTSADRHTGRPAPEANWGRHTVDLAVPGENIQVIDFFGQRSVASGSSFSAPRVAALAVRLLATHPNWHAARLKAAIFARATPVTVDGRPVLAVGTILDPTRP